MHSLFLFSHLSSFLNHYVLPQAASNCGAGSLNAGEFFPRLKSLRMRYFHGKSPTERRPLPTLYCVMGVTGHCWCFLRAMTVLQLQGSHSDPFWHLGPPLAPRLSPNLPPLSLSLSRSPLQPLWVFIWNTFSYLHTWNDINAFLVGFKEDSGAYLKPKVLISYNRLLCGSSTGSSYFCFSRPQLEVVFRS